MGCLAASSSTSGMTAGVGSVRDGEERVQEERNLFYSRHNKPARLCRQQKQNWNTNATNC